MINLNHDIAEVEIMLKALGKMAHDEVAGLILKIKGQAIPQVQAIQAASVAEPVAPVAETTINTEQNVA